MTAKTTGWAGAGAGSGVTAGVSGCILCGFLKPDEQRLRRTGERGEQLLPISKASLGVHHPEPQLRPPSRALLPHVVYSSLPSLVASCPYPCLWPLKGDKARAGILWRLFRFRDTCFRNLSGSKESNKSQVDFEKQEISLAYTWLPWCCLFFTALEREAGAREAAAEGPHDRRVHTTRLQSPSCPWSSPAVCHHRGYRPSDTPPLNLAGTERDSWGCCGAKPTGLLSTRFPQGRLGMILI